MLKQYLKFVIPSICSMVIFNLYTLVDGIFVAHFEGDTALASINVASPYITTIFSIGVLFAIGSSTVMSIYRGANEERKMHEVFSMNTITISCVALCIAVLSFINSHHITEFLGANEDVFNYTDTIFLENDLSSIFRNPCSNKILKCRFRAIASVEKEA